MLICEKITNIVYIKNLSGGKKICFNLFYFFISVLIIVNVNDDKFTP